MKMKGRRERERTGRDGREGRAMEMKESKSEVMGREVKEREGMGLWGRGE